MVREYSDYIQDIIDAINNAEKFTSSLTYDDFREDIKTAFAVVRVLEIIGEAAKSIPESLRTQYPAIPWKEMTGMRDKLIHEYFGVNYEVVWDTVKMELPELKLKLGAALADILGKH
jgi:uncharacterized protein with HEPN domain